MRRTIELDNTAAVELAGEGDSILRALEDHGFVFQGPHWRLDDSPLHGLYHRAAVYRNVTGWQDFEPWLERIVLLLRTTDRWRLGLPEPLSRFAWTGTGRPFAAHRLARSDDWPPDLQQRGTQPACAPQSRWHASTP